MDAECSGQLGSSFTDAIILSSEDETDKNILVKSDTKVRRKVKRRLLCNREIEPWMEHMAIVRELRQDESDSDKSFSSEEIDQGTQTDSDDLVVTQFESPIKKVFTPTKKPRVDQLSDDDFELDNDYEVENRNDNSEKEDCTRYLLNYLKPNIS